MYGTLWRLLPGPTWVKVLEAAVLVLLVAFALLTWVFPVLEPHLPFDDIVIG